MPGQHLAEHFLGRAVLVDIGVIEKVDTQFYRREISASTWLISPSCASRQQPSAISETLKAPPSLI